MLVHKKSVGEATKALYNSSNILASTYDPTKQILEVIFKQGTKYAYKDVDKAAYMRFETADSQGKVLNSHIKKYSFEKLENVEPSGIVTMITSYQEANNRNLMAEYKNRVESLLLTNDMDMDTIRTIKDITDKTIALLED